MGRHVVAAVAVAIISLCVSGIALAQSQGQGDRSAVGPRSLRPPGPRVGSARFAQAQQRRPDASRRMTRERWRQMSPDARQRFRSNAERWHQMDPEQRRALRYREQMRQMRLKREAEEALRQSGLQLEAERRAIYERRYIEERKRIEEALRKEIREKRQRELAPVVERLKNEFGQPARPASPAVTTPVPPSPAPQK